jgi:hypothetical protein
MRKIGIKNKTTLIRRIFLDITSGSVIKDHLYRYAGNPHDVAGVHNWIFSFIRRYRIGSVYLEEMFRLRIVFELSRYGYIRGGRMPDVSEGVRYIERLTESGRVRAARLDWCSIFVDNEIPVDATFGDLDYGQYAFFYNQINTLPWEELIVEYDQKESKITSQYPMQPIHWDNGVIKFEKNPIIDWMADRIGLNEIIAWAQNSKIDEKYVEQLHQLLGYSISLYNNLPGVSDESCAKANAIMESLLAKQGDSQTQPAVPFEQHLSSTQDNFNAKILDRLDTIIDLIKKPKESVMDEIFKSLDEKAEVCSAGSVEPIEDNTVSKEVGDKLHLLIVEGMLCLGPQAISAICKSAAKVVILNCSFHKDQVKHIAQSGKVVIFHDGSTMISYTDSDYFTPRDPVSKPLLGTSFEIHQN